MTLETFFEKFDQFADSPNAVAKMRRLILDFAVTGKLVAQNSDDESASELLKRVQAEKTRLTKTGEIKKQVDLPPVMEDAIPVPLPSGWAATQLGDVAVCLDYMRKPINGIERELRIAGKDQSALFPYYGATQQQGWIDDYIFDQELVLLGEDGVPFFDDLRAKAYLIAGKSWVNNHAHVFRGVLISNSFLMHCLNTFDYRGRVAGSTRSKLNQAKALDIPIALPPLAEQKRIVAKVDELMALCDRLEAQQKERDTLHAALARASLAHFADAPTPANLNFLFHDSYTIEPADLRKTILTLAVQGKLSPQVPSDEPAELWLETLMAATSKNKQRPSRIQASDDNNGGEPFQLPLGWVWLRMDEVFEVAGGIQKTLQRTPRNNAFPYLGVSNVYRGRLDLTNVKDFELEEGELERRRLLPGDLLIIEGNGSINEIGRCAKWNGEIPNCVHQNHVIRCRPMDVEISPFVLLFLNSPAGIKIMQRLAITSSGLYSLSVGKIRQIKFPLPPLSEQRRIVAKVDQLMALVDQLEAQLATARTTATDLMNAMVAELTVET